MEAGKVGDEVLTLVGIEEAENADRIVGFGAFVDIIEGAVSDRGKMIRAGDAEEGAVG
jgi:hypothetical protein